MGSANSAPTLTEVHDMIEAADDMPTSTKLLFFQNEARHREIVERIDDGFDRGAKATKEQTAAIVDFGKRAGIVIGLAGLAAFALLVLLILLLGDTRGADIEKATDGAVKVLDATRALAEPAPDVAASPDGG